MGLHSSGGPELLVPGSGGVAVSVEGPLAGLAAVDTTASGVMHLYRTDGTAAGTAPLASSPSGFLSLMGVGSGALVSAAGLTAPGLYWVDGTTGATSLIGPSGLELVAAVQHQGRPHLLARRGSDGVVYGVDPGGVVELGSIPGLGLAIWARGFSLGSRLVFAVGESFSLVLVTADGQGVSARGFQSVDRVRPGAALAAQLGNEVVFVGTSTGWGDEVWITDGTDNGTRLLSDVLSGPDSSAPSHFVSLGGVVAFAADDRIHGRELWMTDGTDAGTRLLQDLAPGPAGSDPSELVATTQRLFFSANDQSWGRELWSLPLTSADCDPGEFGLCLGDRFRAEIQWRDFSDGIGRGTPVPLTADSGAFWFFDPANLESIVKVLDGRVLNDHWWTFFGSLTNVDFALSVTDVTTGAARRWINPPSNFASAGDTEAFGPRGANPGDVVEPQIAKTVQVRGAGERATGVATACIATPSRLCLNEGRFAVEATWSDFSGNSGTAAVRPITEDTGAFWFFDDQNLEVLVKVLDGRPINGAYWVFYGAISNVEYDLVVTDSQTGEIRTYHNPSGNFASRGDTAAFPE